MRIPSLVLRQLYTFGSLESARGETRFRLKNRLSDARLTGFSRVEIDGEEIAPDRVALVLASDERIVPAALTRDDPIDFPLRRSVEVRVTDGCLAPGKHTIALRLETEPFGELLVSVEDTVREDRPELPSVPYDRDDDYAPAIIDARQRFVTETTGVELDHLTRYSFEPVRVAGNVELFTGVAQIPIGVVGPLKVEGEHARGEYLVPMATTEGTMVASYNRGIKTLNFAGGVHATVVDDCMQRAPVFVFDSAREAREFRQWVQAHLDGIREAAEATSSVARLRDIDTYLSNKFAFLRFNYTTGDAAGQNMVGRATFAACSWILDRLSNVTNFYLESNLATDKKASQVNIMRTRGKRVTAEATIPRRILIEQLRVEPEVLANHASVSTVGAFLSGANNNGAHSPNAITAVFIATGQDVANVAESSAGIVYTEVTPERDLYISLTVPSLIVATHGGGTGLPTQRECLEIMGCWGKGKVGKLAEIVAGVALAGELSLGAAISSLDWISSHERYGRNR